MNCKARHCLAAAALAAAPLLGHAQTHLAVRPDGRLGFGLHGGASVSSGSLLSSASVHVGGEIAVATAESLWRFGCKALWSRTEADITTRNTTLRLEHESRHRWRRGTWFWERLSLQPALRAGESVRGSLDAGLAMTMTPWVSFSLGIGQRYDSAAGKPDTRFVTGLVFKVE